METLAIAESMHYNYIKIINHSYSEMCILPTRRNRQNEEQGWLNGLYGHAGNKAEYIQSRG